MRRTSCRAERGGGEEGTRKTKSVCSGCQAFLRHTFMFPMNREVVVVVLHSPYWNAPNSLVFYFMSNGNDGDCCCSSCLPSPGF